MAVELGPFQVIEPFSRWHGKTVRLRLEAGLVEAIEPVEAATDLYLSPGWVDGLSWTRWPQDPRGQSLLELAASLRQAGYTDALVSSALGWNEPEVLAQLRDEIRESPITLYLLASFWQGERISALESLRLAGAWGWTLPPSQPLPWQAFSEVLPYLRHLGQPVFVLPWWEALSGEEGVGWGPELALSGWRGTPPLVETVAIRALAEFRRLYGGDLWVGPLTTELGLSAAAHENLSVYTGLPYLFFSIAQTLTYDPRWKVHPPLRTSQDVEALWAGLAKGQIRLLASYHHRVPPEEKAHPWGEALSGLSMLPEGPVAFLSECSRRYSLTLGIEVLAMRPRRLLGLPLPRLLEGQPLCHTVFRRLAELQPTSWPGLWKCYEVVDVLITR